MLKRVIYSLVLAFALYLSVIPGTCRAEVVDKIAIVVNSEVVTEGEIDRMLAPIYEQYKTLYKGTDLIKKLEEARQRIITQLIEDRLILCEAKRQNVEVGDKDIEAKLDEARRRFPSRGDFEKALAAQRLTIKDLRARYRDQLMIRRLIDQKVGAKVTITPVDIANYYNAHADEFKQPAEIKLRNILIKPKDDLPPYKASGLAREVMRRLREGGDFAGLAKVYSDGPGAEDGGMMGYVKKGDLLPEIEKKVFELKEGEISGIIQTSLGYHIFKVEEKKAERNLEFSEVRREVEDRIFMEKVRDKIGGWINNLKKNAYIAFK